MREVDVAWAAGLFEGEGCITASTTTAGGHRYRVPRLSLGSTDEDVVRRFHAIVGVGHVRENHAHRRRGHQLQWCWSVTRREQLLGVLDLLEPHLGARRRARAREIREFCLAPSRRI